MIILYKHSHAPKSILNELLLWIEFIFGRWSSQKYEWKEGKTNIIKITVFACRDLRRSKWIDSHVRSINGRIDRYRLLPIERFGYFPYPKFGHQKYFELCSKRKRTKNPIKEESPFTNKTTINDDHEYQRN